jgi:hypothetical protein
VGKKNDRYVVKNPDGGWDVKAGGSKRASAHRDTQAAAEQRAKEIVSNRGGGEVRVQGRDGRFRDSDTVPKGNDPRSSRDTKH